MAIAASRVVQPAFGSTSKGEVYDLLCTSSAKYAKEREDGGVTINKQLITIVCDRHRCVVQPSSRRCRRRSHGRSDQCAEDRQERMVRGGQAASCDLNSSEGGQTSLTFTDRSLKRRQTSAQSHRLRRATPQLVHSEATGDGSYRWKTVLPFYPKGHNLAQRLPSSVATCGSCPLANG